MSVLTMMITTINMYVCMYSYRRMSVLTMMITTIDIKISRSSSSSSSKINIYIDKIYTIRI